MSDVEIEKIFNELNEKIRLSDNAYVFVQDARIYKRREYSSYNYLLDKKQYLKNAIQYTSKSNNYKELLTLSNCYQLIGRAHGGQLENQQITLLCENLELLFEAMDNSGMIDLFVKKHNYTCENEKLDLLKVTKQQILDEFDFKRNTRCNLPTLYLKNAFWLSNYRRVLENIHFQTRFENATKKRAKGKNWYYLICMYSYKDKILESIFEKDILSLPDENIAKNICDQYGETYKSMFDRIFPNISNDMYEEYKEYYEFEMINESIKNKRNALVDMLLQHQILEAKALDLEIKQWGIFKAGEEGFKLGLEPQGYMMPISFYIPTHEYLDVLTSLGIKKYEFPEFTPLTMLKNSNEEIRTNVMVKPTLDQINEIKKQSKQADTRKDYLKRVLEQINGKPHSYTAPNRINFEIGE